MGPKVSDVVLTSLRATLPSFFHKRYCSSFQESCNSLLPSVLACQCPHALGLLSLSVYCFWALSTRLTSVSSGHLSLASAPMSKAWCSLYSIDSPHPSSSLA